LRESAEKAAALAEFDTFNLFGDMIIAEPKEINTIDDVLEEDALGLLGDDVSDEADPNDIFNLKNTPKMPDYIAKRKVKSSSNSSSYLSKIMLLWHQRKKG